MSLRPVWFWFAVCLAFLSVAHADTTHLEDGFRQPPDSAKPRTWWHWVSGNVSSEGITADLQAMKQVGLGGAQIFTVDQSKVKGPVEFMSPEWRKLVHQALAEADQLNLEMAMEGCDGWSESGGHWVEPAQSMQQVVWTESQVQGGQKMSLALPQPQTVLGYYEDIALFAFPTVTGDDLPAPKQMTGSTPGFAGDQLLQTPPGKARLDNAHPGKPLWIQCEFSQPITCRSLFLSTVGSQRPPGDLQVSDDGVSFRKVRQVLGDGSFSFPATTGRYFRIWFPQVQARISTLEFTGIKFSGARIDDIADRVGMRTNTNLLFTPMTLSPEDMIDPKALVDLTGKTEWSAPAGKWTLIRLGHTSTGATTHPSTTPGLECDKLSRAAVDDHIQHMYGPVFEDSPALVGRSFRYMLLDSWEAGCENWTPLMRDEFKKRRGYDLWPWLPALTGRVVLSADATERFLWDYRRTLADLVADNHYGAFQAAAHAHHMGLYAEATGISMPTVADQLQCKGRTDIPMGEFWVHQKGDENVDDPKEAATAAHIYGGNIAATESFTSLPVTAAWTNDPYSLKMEGDKEFCLGVNRFVFHRYAHQPWLDRSPGMSMGPWGINFERTNTWWTQGSAWISYLSRCEDLLQRGRFVADLCYFYGEGAPVCVQHTRLLPKVPAGYDYDVCNAEILLGQMSVQDGQIVLKSGMHYRVLVLPDMDRMTLAVLRKVQSLIADGAVVYGPKPVSSPSLADYLDGDGQLQSVAKEVWGDCDGKKVTEHAYGKGRVVWGQPLVSVLGAPADFEADQKNIIAIHRVDENADIYFVSNQQSLPRETECTFRVTGKTPELWHPDTGKMETAALYSSAKGRTTLPISFDPSGSVFVIFRKDDAKADHPVAMVRTDAGADSLSSSLQILKATYGSADGVHAKDVTAALRALIQKGVLDVDVNNAAFGGDDPAPMTPKQLTVEYSLDGKQASQTLKESETLLIASPQTFYPDSSLLVDDKLNIEATHAGTYSITMAGGEIRPVSIATLPAPAEVTGTWTLDFPPKWGAPSQVTLDRLASWTDNADPGVKYFSGTATYHCAMTVPSNFIGEGRCVYLDLGEVKNLAEVAINGKSLGILWKAPFRMDVTDAVKSGSNQLEIKVTNLWPNRLIGDLQLPEDKRLTWTSVSLYKKDSPLLVSGLLGPVELIPSQKIPIAAIADKHP
jgi:alpha-L-rhamnosidase